MKVNQDTYEHYFLLYIDNELSASEKAEVEAFIQAYPTYAADLNALQNSRIHTEDIIFDHKHTLYHISTSDEQCLTYLENEMSSSEKNVFEQALKKTPALNYQLANWEKTILKKEAVVELSPFFKQGLYKKEAATIQPVYNWHNKRTYISIAAMCILIIGYSVLQKSDTKTIAKYNATEKISLGATPLRQVTPLSQKNIYSNSSNLKTIASVKYNSESIRNNTHTIYIDKDNSPVNDPAINKEVAITTVVQQPGETIVEYKSNENNNAIIESNAIVISEMDAPTNEIINKAETFKNIDIDEEERTLYIGNIELDGSAFRGVARRINSFFKRTKIDKEK